MPERVAMERRFVTVDVFTERRFGGNPLAVVLDAEGLSTAGMQRFAAEFNLAETTFVLPPKDARHTAEVRIFTPRAELPFAGHPNVGTAFVLAQLGTVFGKPVGDPLTFEEKCGIVRVDLIKDKDAVLGARVAAPSRLIRGADIAADIVANACSLAMGDVATDQHPPCVASCGLLFVFAQLKTRAALAAARPRVDIFSEHINPDVASGILLYVADQHADIDVHVRMFAPHLGIMEDPATGSANAALAGLLATLSPERDLSLQLTIAQGVDMGRPSRLEATAEKRDGEVTAMWIGGKCVPVMRGTMETE
jgi:trans-2,3-dihydro-3-hydroxyanthranilate isomerase